MIGAIAGGLLSGLGTAYAGYKAYEGTKDTNESNQQISAENREFQRQQVAQAQAFEVQQSSTAYQRAMADMKEAGLNPMLAYQQGGASTPIGKTAPGTVIPMQNPDAVWPGVAQGLSSAVSTSSDLATAGIQRDKLEQEIENLGAEFELTYAQRQQVFAHAGKFLEETRAISADNVSREAVADFIESAEFAAIAKSMGVTPATLGAIFRRLFPGKGKR